jgi:hypothetical protein
VFVTVAVAVATSDVLPGVGHRDFFLREVQVADVTAAVVGAFRWTGSGFGFLIKQ